MPRLTLWHVIVIVAVCVMLVAWYVYNLDPHNAVRGAVIATVARYGWPVTIWRYAVSAPFKEELLFRSVPLLFVLVFRPIRMKNWWYWAIVIGLNSWWTINHGYPWQYQSLVFSGGLFSGWLILYFNQEDSRSARIQSLFAPVIAHAEANAIVLGWVWYTL